MTFMLILCTYNISYCCELIQCINCKFQGNIYLCSQRTNLCVFNWIHRVTWSKISGCKGNLTFAGELNLCKIYSLYFPDISFSQRVWYHKMYWNTLLLRLLLWNIYDVQTKNCNCLNIQTYRHICHTLPFLSK